MSDKVTPITDDQFETEVLKADKPVLVDFWAPWCGPCRTVGPIVEELSEEIAEVKFCKVNVDENGGYAGKFGIMSIPTLILFKDGEIVNRQVGALQKDELSAFIKNNL